MSQHANSTSGTYPDESSVSETEAGGWRGAEKETFFAVVTY